MARRQAANDGLGIGQLGDDVGAYERGDLDSFYTTAMSRRRMSSFTSVG